MKSNYRGRFAPSPTGPLHLGSMFCALGSFLQARKNRGQWLIRIEDLDPPREIKGAASKILQTLEAFGLYWDEDVLYQSDQHDLYEKSLSTLNEYSLTYKCQCSRKQIQQIASLGLIGYVYPGTCRNKNLNNNNCSVRLVADMSILKFKDLLQGENKQDISKQIGDIILRRENGLYGYQLAVVVDDYYQNITEVVRGFDLFNCSPIQIYLQKSLHFPTPDYLHLPILVHQNRDKLSKQTKAMEVDHLNVEKTLYFLLQILNQSPPENLQFESKENIISWAIQNWKVEKLMYKKEIEVKTNL